MSTAAVDTGVRGYLGFLRQSARKQLVLLWRYPVNTLSQLGTIFLVFLVLFFGGQALAPAAMEDTIGGLVVGYLLWSMSISAYSGLAWNVTREAQWGTLEQLFMSPFGFGRVMLGRTVVNLAESFLWGAATLVFMLAVTGQSLALDPLTVVPLGLLAIMPAVGVGFVFGGLAIRFKRIENAFQLVQFLFIGLISAPVGEYPLLGWLPLAQGSYLLRRAMEDGTALWELPANELGVLVLTAVLYLGLGYAAFTYCQRWARRAGVMGHY
ncbi:ABC transporter permease [Haloarchaeobius iranensis]|uniref:ABC-2 type transport system permease protein n=1 Tax=Haloarchaeobius iranensis TaxID=996166 RepID=A0A1G9WJJ3_9EURY|nr:ABC transporter permease [Haloarchaeobius iranensis]SDM84708.1 ABC-2 type transport system permease protein [Haloarchaeobius iranensis]